MLGAFLAGAVGVIAQEQSSPATYPAAPGGARITAEGWFAPGEGRIEKPSLPETVTRAFVIPVREEISGKTFEALRRKALSARSRGAELIVLDMDTFGGQVIAALNIARFIKQLDDIYVVCYARTRSISAGALIAMACDEIVMADVGKFGDCAPIVMQGELKGVQREKAESPLRAEFTESAERNGYSLALAQSMVTIGSEVWLVRNKQTRELRFVLAKDFRGRVIMPPGLTSGPSVETADWELLRVVVSAGELLTMRPSQAVEYGFASQIIKPDRDDPLAPLMKHYNVVGSPALLADTWSEKLVGFLTSPVVTAALLMGGLFFAYIEMHTPGFGVAGSLAVTCFAVLFGSRFLIGLANWWEIALFVIGLALIVVEIFVTPGFGAAGISGIVCCIVSLLAIAVANRPSEWPIPETSMDWQLFADSAVALGIGFILSVVAAAMVSRYLPKLPVVKGLVLFPATAATEAPVSIHSPMLQIAPGDEGVAESMCHPVGKVRFGNDLVDAASEGDPIEAGTKVRVLRNEGNRIVVERIGTA